MDLAPIFPDKTFGEHAHKSGKHNVIDLVGIKTLRKLLFERFPRGVVFMRDDTHRNAEFLGAVQGLHLRFVRDHDHRSEGSPPP